MLWFEWSGNLLPEFVCRLDDRPSGGNEELMMSSRWSHRGPVALEEERPELVRLPSCFLSAMLGCAQKALAKASDIKGLLSLQISL